MARRLLSAGEGVGLFPEAKSNASGTETSAADKPRKARGTVVLKPERCKGCGFCIAFCPPHVLEFSAGFNAQGYHPPELVNPEGCTGCDLCGLYCPDFAIYGVMLKYSSGSDATERRGEA
jgi:2-oxoglutarate ferredoxin oxidoreductase subunit delta